MDDFQKFIFVIQLKVELTKTNLIKFGALCDQLVALNLKIGEMSMADDELRRTGAVRYFFTETCLRALDAYKEASKCAKLEAETWQKIKGMTDKERSTYFLSKYENEIEKEMNSAT